MPPKQQDSEDYDDEEFEEEEYTTDDGRRSFGTVGSCISISLVRFRRETCCVLPLRND